MADTPVKKPRLRVVDMPTTTTVRRSSRNKSSSEERMGGEWTTPRGKGSRTKAAPARRTPSVTKSPERQRWDKATDGITSIHGAPFNPSKTYGEGDIVLHKQFGLGVVEKAEEGKMEIDALFRDGVKTLELTEEEIY